MLPKKKKKSQIELTQIKNRKKLYLIGIYLGNFFTRLYDSVCSFCLPHKPNQTKTQTYRNTQAIQTLTQPKIVIFYYIFS